MVNYIPATNRQIALQDNLIKCYYLYLVAIIVVIVVVLMLTVMAIEFRKLKYTGM